ncbi:hypothetical protein [Cognatitamlana onchidii]|uniref:hypothetical protein n=1 Tax=Cognatitamlana onchidii TaxID=2562860 RepID=UPI001F481477|nr:hypothetical protein [Algibacter onchidii]
MTFTLKPILISMLLLFSCNTGKLNILTSIDHEIDEASAIEIVKGFNLFWTIEDSGNQNYLFGLNQKGNIAKKIRIKNAKNKDWEDLTSDSLGNIYIGDFGNNHKKRKHFSIHKVQHSDLDSDEAIAKTTNFSLPKDMASEDFEAFFLLNNNFYIFSKNAKKSTLLRVANKEGKQKAKLVTTFKLEGKQTKITSAAISPDKNIIVLLNHDKLWQITNFDSQNFLKGDLKKMTFDHSSQKEGICFKNDSIVYITDERTKGRESYIYTFNLKDSNY